MYVYCSEFEEHSFARVTFHGGNYECADVTQMSEWKASLLQGPVRECVLLVML